MVQELLHRFPHDILHVQKTRMGIPVVWVKREILLHAIRYLRHAAKPFVMLYDLHATDERLRTHRQGLPDSEFVCRGSQLPSSSMGMIDVPYMGRQLKVAGNRIFTDWTITVLNDTNFAVRQAVEAWSSLINGHESNVGPVDINAYYRNATVQQLDQAGGILYTYEFKDIWPTEISEIELAFDSNDQIEEFTITFAVGSYWLSNGAA